jgi:hypothetical protein
MTFTKFTMIMHQIPKLDDYVTADISSVTSYQVLYIYIYIYIYQAYFLSSCVREVLCNYKANKTCSMSDAYWFAENNNTKKKKKKLPMHKGMHFWSVSYCY